MLFDTHTTGWISYRNTTWFPLGITLGSDKAAVSHVLTEDELCLLWISGAVLPTVQQLPPTGPGFPGHF